MNDRRAAIQALSARLQADLLALNGRMPPAPRELQLRILLPLGAAALVVGVALLAGRKKTHVKLMTLALLRLLVVAARPPGR